jgi:hypothetical protein
MVEKRTSWIATLVANWMSAQPSYSHLLLHEGEREDMERKRGRSECKNNIREEGQMPWSC